MQPGRKTAAFYVLSPTVLPFPVQIDIRSPRGPITVLFRPSRRPGSKVDFLVCSVWASRSVCRSGRIPFYHQERVHSEGRFLTQSDENERESIPNNIYDIIVIFRTYYLPIYLYIVYRKSTKTTPSPHFQQLPTQRQLLRVDRIYMPAY
jgi:hypothetical protein